MLQEESLVRRVIAGDPAAEEEFFGMYRPRLYRTTTYFLGYNDSEVDDVVQDTFVIAIPRLKDYVFDAPIYAWLRQICLRLCYARMRGRRRMLMSAEEDLEVLLCNRAVEKLQQESELIEKEQKLNFLQELKKQLCPESRQIIELRHGQGLTYSSISQTLKIPMGTVMSRLARAREQIRKLATHRPEMADKILS